MAEVQKKVEELIRREQRLEMGDRVVLAVSGGADSMCMMEVLAALRDSWKLELLVVHVHHGLRGAEADRDAAFVQDEAGKLGIGCVVERRDVRSVAAERGLSLEEAGRDVRYEILREYAKNWTSQGVEMPTAHEDDVVEPAGGCGSEASGLAGCRPAKIAVAHHQEDQAETILHNLFRGSGLKGLGGMSARRGQIIRPLLCLEKKEILEYLAERHIAYCEDSTNQENEYTRNRLRNELIPQIRREINDRAVEHITEAGARLRQADAYFEELAEKIWRECGVTKKCAPEEDMTDQAAGTKPGGERRVETTDENIYGIKRSELLRDPLIVRTYVIRHMIALASQSLKDITSDHIDQVAALLEKETGKQLNLPYGLTAWTEYDFLWISRQNPSDCVDNQSSISLIMKKIPYEKEQEIPQNRYTKWFDYDKIKGTLTVRTRQTGDYITLKDGRKKTVKAYMIDEKIPRELRDRITLLAEDHHVLWIVGWRISEYYKVTEDTDYVLEVQADGGRENG